MTYGCSYKEMMRNYFFLMAFRKNCVVALSCETTQNITMFNVLIKDSCVCIYW